MFYVGKKREDGSFGVINTEAGTIEYYQPSKIMALAFKDNIPIEGVNRQPNAKVSIKVLKPSAFNVLTDDIYEEDTKILKDVAEQLAAKLSLSCSDVLSDENGCYVELRSFKHRYKSLYICIENESIFIEGFGQQGRILAYHNNEWKITDADIENLNISFNGPSNNTQPVATKVVQEEKKLIKQEEALVKEAKPVKNEISDDINDKSLIIRFINKIEKLTTADWFLQTKCDISYHIIANVGTLEIQETKSFTEFKGYILDNLELLEANKDTKIDVKMHCNAKDYLEVINFNSYDETITSSFIANGTVINTKNCGSVDSMLDVVTAMHEARTRYSFMKTVDLLSNKTNVKHTNIDTKTMDDNTKCLCTKFTEGKFVADVTVMPDDKMLFSLTDGHKIVNVTNEIDFLNILHTISEANELTSKTKVEFQCTNNPYELHCCRTVFSLKYMNNKVHLLIGSKTIPLPDKTTAATNELNKVYDLLCQIDSVIYSGSVGCDDLIKVTGNGYEVTLTNGAKLNVK